MPTQLNVFSSASFLSELRNSFDTLEELNLTHDSNNATDEQWAEFLSYLPQCTAFKELCFEDLQIGAMPLIRLQALRHILAECKNLQIIYFPVDYQGDDLGKEHWDEMIAFIISCKQVKKLFLDKFTSLRALPSYQEESICTAVAQCANLQYFEILDISLKNNLSLEQCQELGPDFVNSFKVQTITFQKDIDLQPELLNIILGILKRCPKQNLEIINESKKDCTSWNAILRAHNNYQNTSDINFRQALIESFRLELEHKEVLKFYFDSLQNEDWEIFGEAFKFCLNVKTFNLDFSYLTKQEEDILGGDGAFEVVMQACAQFQHLQKMRLILPKEFSLDDKYFKLIAHGIKNMQGKILQEINFKNFNLPFDAENTPQVERFNDLLKIIATDLTMIQKVTFTYQGEVSEAQIAAVEAIKAASQEFNYYIKGWGLYFKPNYKISYENAALKTANFFSFFQEGFDEKLWQKNLLPFLTSKDVSALEKACVLRQSDAEKIKNFIIEHFKQLFNKTALNELQDIKSFLDLGSKDEILDSNINQNISMELISDFINQIISKESRRYASKEKAYQCFEKIFSLANGETHLQKFYFRGILKPVLEQAISQISMLYAYEPRFKRLRL